MRRPVRGPGRRSALLYGVVAVWGFIVVFPLYWMITTAFKQRPDIFPFPRYIPWLQFEPTLAAFRTVLTDYRSQVVNALVNSVIAAAGSALLATLLGALAGYALYTVLLRRQAGRQNRLLLLRRGSCKLSDNSRARSNIQLPRCHAASEAPC